MLKRLMTARAGRRVPRCSPAAAAAAPLRVPCYGKSFQRDGRQMMDFVDVYFLNYDKHDPYRCDPCLGD